MSKNQSSSTAYHSIPTTTFAVSGDTTFTYAPYSTPYSTGSWPSSLGGWQPSNDMWPWASNDDLSEEDVNFIKDFKTRHPDFDAYYDEINLILARQPGLKNTILFLPTMYQLAVEIRRRIEAVFNAEEVEKVVDGKTP